MTEDNYVRGRQASIYNPADIPVEKMPTKMGDFKHKGTLFKKRGGLLRNVPATNWIPRTFGLTFRGLLVYYEAPTIQEASVGGLQHPRQVLDLTQPGTYWSTPNDMNDGPTGFMIMITHDDKRVDHGTRLKLCANTQAELQGWVAAISVFCTSEDGDRSPNRGLSPVRRQSASDVSSSITGAITALQRDQQKVRRRKRRRRAPKPAKPGFFAPGGAFELISLYTGLNVLLGVLPLIRRTDIHAMAIFLVNVIVTTLLIHRTSHLPAPALEEEEEEEEEEISEEDIVEAGRTVERVEPNDDKKPSFSVGKEEEFPIRTLGYAKHHKKAPSCEPLYELIALDVFRTKNRVDRIYERLNFPWDLPDTKHPDVPPLLVFNVQFPRSDEVKMSSDGDGPGASVVFYFRITEKTLKSLKLLQDNNFKLNDDLIAQYPELPALHLLCEWCRLAPDDPVFRGRFKCMGFIQDIQNYGIPSVATRYNGKPVLIKKTGSMHRGPNFIEMDVNVHRFSYLCRVALSGMKEKFKDMVIRAGFVIEGRDDEELPEVLLGCAHINGVNLDVAQDL